MFSLIKALTDALVKNDFSSVSPWILFWVGVSCIGFILWLYTYVLAMRYGFRYQSYAIPWLAVCLNFGWELLASFVWNMEFTIWHVGCLLWMLFDTVIVYQVLRFGAAQQPVPEIRAHFQALVVVVFLLGVAGQYTFTAWSRDTLGIVDSFIINLIMSVSFILQYFERRQSDDLTYSISWYKMLGTGLVSVTMVPLFPWLYPNENYSFMWFICPLIFVVDCLYISMLAKARKQAAASASQAPAAPAPAMGTAA